MSLLSVVSNSLSGFRAFTKTLDNLSHNVANMNSPGYKKQDSYFRELNDNQTGDGVRFSGSATRFTQGDIYSTGQDTNLAIDGAGFFIIENNGKLLYTRAGQFEFNEDKLVDVSSGGSIMALAESGELVEIDISTWQVSQSEPTTEVELSGNLSSLSTTGTEFPLNTDTPAEFQVYDSQGEAHTLTITYTKEPEGDWRADVRNFNDEIIGTGLLRFTSAGSPMADSNSFAFELVSEGGVSQSILVNAGEPGEFSGLTSFPSQTNGISAENRDGRGVGALLSATFNEQGGLVLSYTNGASEEPYEIALAYFKDNSVLQGLTDSVFSAESSPQVIATADESIVGNIRTQSLERSNVDVTDEFSEIIIIQRGYQACSQVLSVSSEMLEELYNSSRGR
ncbi:flagellar hook-basal body complex protein [Microbulbifer rhizosphaerae]|uniref:Flagellar hook protein FlgE n=1 Tax=Microbulbifer rhizosphaerae TaxID=1562603 RepID=A0A7W4WFZ5_9GAMM|nr:flagellar hook-basal body complex protein [Microbulbifer rhizosphaerae]MBB3063498.1 flagellar hook protein FlgE [Microbulbifer rhizosphaerae]